jgi:hypothetical protein
MRQPFSRRAARLRPERRRPDDVDATPEALVWLTDFAGLDRGDARELMRWTVQALLQAAAGNPPPRPTAQREPVRGAAAPSP